MKKILLLLFVLGGAALSANAQDLITTIGRETIQAKVLEVSPTTVKYKRASNPDGPTYTIYTSDLIKIRYENGEEDIFNEALAYEGSPYAPSSINILKYRHYKGAYNPRLYVSQWGDPYSPGWSGIASAVIPGFGQALCDEWGRAAAFFFGNLALTCAAAAALENDSYGLEYSFDSDYLNEGDTVAGILGLANLAVYVWGICDAVRVAKVKNMYYQSMRTQNAGLNVRLEPFLASTHSPASPDRFTAAGLSLRVSF